MSTTTNSSPSNTVSVLLGTLAAFASFAVFAALIQGFAGGKPSDPLSPVRLKNKEDVSAEQIALLEKYGVNNNSTALFTKAAEELKTRKLSTSTIVVPGSATALKATPPPAPSPAAAPATSASPAPTAVPAAK
jgi:hypothetical protein